MARNYIRRGEWFHYQRRVPSELARYDRRKHVRISLKTQNEHEAKRRAAIYDEFVETYWNDLIKAGEADPRGQRFAEVKQLAQSYGFAYKSIAENATAPTEELVRRLEQVGQSVDSEVTAALLGSPGTNIAITLSECHELFWPLCADRFIGKSEYQITKYKNPRNAALKNFIAVIGNRTLPEIQRSHILQFRTWLMQKIAAGEFVGNTANKQLSFVKDILNTVALANEIDLNTKLLFVDARLVQEKRSRPPFEAAFVREHFVDGNSLDNLNLDARRLIWMMIETGARESEIIGLAPSDFFLKAEVPHIWIRKNEIREIKTASSDRKIPLVGIALKTAKAIAETGLTRYQSNPDSASAAINKHFKVNGLKPTPRHTLYSLRHCFKDRLRDAGAPEEIVNELMGHAKVGPQYGRGHKLATKEQWLKNIAYGVPSYF